MTYDTLNLDTITDTEEASHALLFAIASTRAKSEGLIKLTSSDEKIRNFVKKMLKKAKNDNKIRCFISGDEFVSEDTAVIYMCEKCPEISNDPDKNENTVYILI